MSTRRFFRRPGRLGGIVVGVGLVVVVALAVLLGSALTPSGHSHPRSGGTASEGPAHVANPLAGRITKVVGTNVSAARYGEEVAALEDFGENLAGEKVSDLSPIPAARFKQPVKEYKAYAHAWIGRTIGAARALGEALEGGSRADAQRAWDKAWGDYMHLGADYGLFGDLEEELDGTAGGPETSAKDPNFVGFRRLEWGLWTGRPLGSLTSYDDRLVHDLKRLRAAVPEVEIDALDYATRGHEIIEDAQRDLMSGMDVPWSHQGVLGTAAALASVEEVFRTLKPLLSGREDTEGEVANWLHRLHQLFDSMRRHGTYPTLPQMSEQEHERFNGYVAGALSALQMVPSSLETELYKAPPSIGRGR
ncbi:MAG TPA: EfeM/EfeO family lipoprotein [Solirubrobacterales bacterium]|nr:EfeM/EfeO family lipoprotein [Solirubrobacterales bacterium]